MPLHCRRGFAPRLRPGCPSPTARYVGGVLLLAAAYYGAAKLGQTLRYTASVAAIWPPAGLASRRSTCGDSAGGPACSSASSSSTQSSSLGDAALPLGSLLGQQAGNMAEIIVGALLLRRLIGPRAALDRADQVGGMLVALGAATAISATVGTVSMLAGGVIDESDVADLLADLVARRHLGRPGRAAADARVGSRSRRGMAARSAPGRARLLIATVAVLGVIAVSTDEPVTYMVFPALIWAAFRFGPPGATLSIAIAAGVAIGVTAHEVGPFFKQPIDHRTLSTQVYIVVAALTTLFLSAVVSERERSAAELAEAKRREGERAVEERHRIARDLHDSVSQALFSTAPAHPHRSEGARRRRA